ncbi:MAG TPA: glycosyltransferase [Candidatus Saccharimonadia bacterium]|nr:glycosyltransferase [Candidatus Saccharimonadia bacterium]
MKITPARKLAKDLLKRAGLYGRVSAAARKYRYREYTKWVVERESQAGPDSSGKTKFSIIVPTHKYTARYLEPLIDSVVAQTYPNWELVLVNACETAADAEQVRRAAKRDGRIKVVELARNLHISGNTNAGIEVATGGFVSFLDHDDVIAPFALSEMSAALDSDHTIQIFYSDEDKISEDGKERFYAFFKPDFDPELILTSSYACHFFSVRANLAKKAGGLRPAFDGAQDYDFILRLLQFDPVIKHVPRVSYHWRMAQSSTASVISEKDYAADAGRRALGEHVKRLGLPANVEDVPGQATAYRLKYDLPAETRVAVVSSGPTIPGIDVLTPAQSASALDRYDLLIYLADGIAATGGDWIRELAARAIQPDVGVVSAAVLNGKGLAPAGYVVAAGRLQLLTQNIVAPEFTLLGLSSWPRSFMVVPEGCYAVKTALLRNLASGAPGSCLNLCLRLHQAGLRNIFWPYAQLRLANCPLPPSTLPLPSGLEGPPDPSFNPNLTIKNHRATL